MACLFEWLHSLAHDLGAVLVRELVGQGREEVAQPRARRFPLLRPPLDHGFPIWFLFFAHMGRLNLRLTPLTQLASGHEGDDGRLCHRAIPRCTESSLFALP